MAKVKDSERVSARLKADKVTAASVRKAVGEKLGLGYSDPVPMDITGNPTQLVSHRRYQQQEQAALLEVKSDLFLRKIIVEAELPNGTREDRTYLITKGRVSAGIYHDDWIMMAWTNSLTELIRDTGLSKTEEWEHPKTGVVQKLTIMERGTYDGSLLPKLTDVTYELGGRPIFVADETDYLGDAPASRKAVADDSAAEEKPEAEYRATSEFGLQEIIQQADPKQWKTLHLPFRSTVLVEGPPGSGKTSIGLMRVPCLIDRQWDELKLDP